MKLIFGMQPYSNPTRRIMEDNLNIFEKTTSFYSKGRRPPFLFVEKWK
jgi:hypothetical protein